ncbi:hypothetical protein ABPG72_020587 [Tetrahymena utriculariae]
MKDSSSKLGIIEHQQQRSQDQQQQLENKEELSNQIVVFFQEMLDLLLKILEELEIILVQSNQQAKLLNLIHQSLLLVEQLQKLPLGVHKILQRFISIARQNQKELSQYSTVLVHFYDVVEQLLDNPEQPFSFLTQLIQILQEFFNIREKHKDNSSQFQLMLQKLQIIKEKNDQTELEIKSIPQRLHKTVSQPENIKEQPLNMEQNNNQDNSISLNDNQKQNNSIIQQEFQSISNQQKFEIQQNVKNLNSLSQSYSSQLKMIFDKIKEYQLKEYENLIESDHFSFQIKRVWEQEIFEKINVNITQNGIFQSLKSKIFERLKQEQFYLCKIIYSNQIEDLILGFFQVDDQEINEYEILNSEYIFKIIYNSDSVQSDINSYIQLFETLRFQFKLIKLEKENNQDFKYYLQIQQNISQQDQNNPLYNQEKNCIGFLQKVGIKSTEESKNQNIKDHNIKNNSKQQGLEKQSQNSISDYDINQNQDFKYSLQSQQKISQYDQNKPLYNQEKICIGFLQNVGIKSTEESKNSDKKDHSVQGNSNQQNIQQKCQETKSFGKFDNNLKTIEQNEITKLLKEKLKNQYEIELLKFKGGQSSIYKIMGQKDPELILKCYSNINYSIIKQEIQIYGIIQKTKDQKHTCKLIKCIKINESIFGLIFEKQEIDLANYIYPVSQISGDEVMKIITDLILGLLYLRKNSIVHLDIKLLNILKTNTGDFIYIDFGISQIKILGLKLKPSNFTKGYAPEEQLQSQQQKEKNEMSYKTDVYSLAQSLLYVIKQYQDQNDDDDDKQRDILNFQNKKRLNADLLYPSLNQLSDEDFFEFFYKVKEIKEKQDEKQENCKEINKIDELKEFEDNHKQIIINLRPNSKEDKISYELMKQILEPLQNKCIQNCTLKLNKWGIDDTNTVQIGSAVQKLNLFKFTLELAWNKIQSTKFIQEASLYFQKLIYLELILKENQINEEESNGIGLALRKCPNLKILYLDLGSNKFGNQGTLNIFQSIQSKNLRKLIVCLNKNNIGQDGALQIGKFLEQSYLTQLILELNENNIQNDGVISIVKGLQEPYCISYLKLGFNHNNISVEGAEHILNFLNQNNNFLLTNFELDLSWNQIKYEESQKLVESLINYKELFIFKLNLKDNLLKKNQIEEIYQKIDTIGSLNCKSLVDL